MSENTNAGRNHPVATRRGFVGGLAGAAGAVTLGNGLFMAATAQAKAPPSNTQIPYWYRFKLGGAECTVVSDGPFGLGDPSGLYPTAPKEELSKLLHDSFLPEKTFSVEQNALVVNSGSQLVLFDNGMGGSPLFGPTTGKLMQNLQAAGIGPGDIDAVVLSHAHPDHCWGTTSPDGKPNFPNARIYLSKADFDFWTDEGKLTAAALPAIVKALVEGTRKTLLPVRDRITFVEDGKEILPGVQALATPGHTVGHMAYLITSGDKVLAYTGDVAPHPVLSLQKPQYAFGFDTDPSQASETRVKVLAMLAKERIPLLVYHFPFPGIGHVTKDGEGYHYYPMPMQMTL